MEQPKRELKLTAKEIAQNKIVSEKAGTKEFADFAKKTYRVDMKDGEATPIVQKRKIIVAKPGSGQTTKVVSEEGTILYEAAPGSKKEKEMLRKLKSQEAATNASRERSAQVINYQTGRKTDGNPVYEDKLKSQELRKRVVK